MHRVLTGFAQTFNRKYGRVGTLLQGRFKSKPVESGGHIENLIPYIALNPVSAGFCEHPADYPWSACAAIAGRRRAPDWLAIEWVRSWYAEDTAEGAQRYLDVCLRRAAWGASDRDSSARGSGPRR
jgi:putative transposase